MEIKKLITAVLTCLFVGTIIGCVLQSCKVNKAAASTRTIYIPLIVEKIRKVPVHDTIKPAAHPRMSNAELQKYLEPFEKANYDNFFAPDLKKLTQAVNQLSQSNHEFAMIISDMRARSIRRADSSNRAYKTLSDLYVNTQKRQIQRNADQINSLNSITNFLLALGVIMAFLILCLIGLAIYFNGKLRQILKMLREYAKD